MKLTKVNVTEGIKLSEVKYYEWIYYQEDDKIEPLCQKDGLSKKGHLTPNWLHYIIRDNKIIPIIKDEEYNNEKPYLIGKDENCIVGVIVFYGSLKCYKTISDAFGINDERNTKLQYIISNLNNKGYNVYKQE